jgi:hypothetical protein
MIRRRSEFWSQVGMAFAKDGFVVVWFVFSGSVGCYIEHDWPCCEWVRGRAFFAARQGAKDFYF